MDVFRLLCQRSGLQPYLDFVDNNSLSLASRLPLHFRLRDVGPSTSCLPRGLLRDSRIEIVSAISSSKGVTVRVRFRSTGCTRQVFFGCKHCNQSDLMLRDGARVRFAQENHWANGQLGVAEAHGEAGFWRVRLDQGRRVEFVSSTSLHTISMRVCHHFSGAQLEFFNGKRCGVRGVSSPRSSALVSCLENSEPEEPTSFATCSVEHELASDDDPWSVAPIAHSSEVWDAHEQTDENISPSIIHHQSYQDCVAEMDDDDIGDMMDLLGSMQPEL